RRAPALAAAAEALPEDRERLLALACDVLASEISRPRLTDVLTLAAVLPDMLLPRLFPVIDRMEADFQVTECMDVMLKRPLPAIVDWAKARATGLRYKADRAKAYALLARACPEERQQWIGRAFDTV